MINKKLTFTFVKEEGKGYGKEEINKAYEILKDRWTRAEKLSLNLNNDELKLALDQNFWCGEYPLRNTTIKIPEYAAQTLHLAKETKEAYKVDMKFLEDGRRALEVTAEIEYELQ